MLPVISASAAPLSASDLVSHVRPGPRYTSYPPATEFTAAFDPAVARAELARLGATAPRVPISLYCHVPFCSSLCWYCGCNVVITRDRARGSAYVDTLLAEIGLVADALGDGQPVTEISLGGGSPNFLDPADMARLIDGIRARFALADDAELGVELDPRDTSAAHLAALARLGFTRMSVGVQDFTPAVQEAIHRIQSVEATYALIAEARRAGFEDINADLIYGLPLQTPATLRDTIGAVLTMAPERVAIFGYAHLPDRRPHQKLVARAGALPGASERADLLLTAIEQFEDAGYVRIGMDHFARPDSALARAAREGRLHRNFQGYVIKRAEQLIGCGVTAISDSGGAYWQNTAELPAYERAIAAGQLPIARGVALTEDDRLRREVINRLMCDFSLEFRAIEDAWNVRVEDYFADELDELRTEHDELVVVDDDARRIQATALGANLIRNVCMVFDAHRRARTGSFSPTV